MLSQLELWSKRRQGFLTLASRGLAKRGFLIAALVALGTLPVGAQTPETPGDAVAAAEPHVRLGLALRELGRDDEAIEAFRQALAVDADDTAARLNLGAMLADDGDVEGLEHLRSVVAGDPDDSWARYELGEGLRKFARWEEALDHYQRLVALDLAHENGRVGEAEALTALGRFSESISKLENALEAFPESRGVRFGLAWLMAACPEPELRDGERALALAEALFTERRSLGAFEIVAAARAELGRCDEALQIQRSVVSEALHHGRSAESTARLSLAAEWYAGEPCRVPAGRPADERPLWPRSRPATAAGDAAPSHDH